MYDTINARYHDFWQENIDKRELVFYGGSGSGKSSYIAQTLLKEFLTAKTPTRMLFSRKWLSALKNTLLPHCIEILEAWDKYDKVEHNRADNIMRFGKNRIDFLGLDNPEKIKGADYRYIWLEETTDFNHDDFKQFTLRLGRAKSAVKPKYIFSFNPIDDQHWTWTDLVQTTYPDRAVIHSTYEDNYENLSEEWIQKLENFINIDTNYYNVYRLGKPGVLKDLIYNNWIEVQQGFPRPLKLCPYDCAGLDFGFTRPASLVYIKRMDDHVLVDEGFHRTKMGNADIIDWLKLNHDPRIPIYADSAEPKSIAEIRKAGFTIYPAEKSVKPGIDYVRRQKLHITKQSVNVISEIRKYKYREIRGIIYEEPVPIDDHAMDALRYGIWTHFGQYDRDMQIPDEWTGFGGTVKDSKDSRTMELEDHQYSTILGF